MEINLNGVVSYDRQKLETHSDQGVMFSFEFPSLIEMYGFVRAIEFANDPSLYVVGARVRMEAGNPLFCLEILDDKGSA